MRGTSWDDAVTAEVLAPLGMTRTTPRPVAPAAEGWAVHPWADVVLPEPEHHAGVMAAAGQLWAPLADLGRFAAFLLGDTADVLDPATLEEMTVPAGVDSSAPGWAAYGLGVQVLRIDGRTLVGHGGSMPGFLAGVFVDREEQTGAVSLANTTSGLDTVVFGLLGDLRTAEPRIVEPWTPSPSPVPLDRLGVWFWGPAPHAAALGRRRAAAPGPAARPGRAGPAGSRRGTTARGSGWTATSPGEELTIAEDHLEPRHVHLHADALRPRRPRARRRGRARLALMADGELERAIEALLDARRPAPPSARPRRQGRRPRRLAGPDARRARGGRPARRPGNRRGDPGREVVDVRTARGPVRIRRR